MGFFDLFQQADIDQGVKEYLATPGAVLLDVRTSEEYRDGHIPGSKNVPLQALDKVASVAENKNMALYVYCHSGARSRQAAGLLRRMGYRNVNNIGHEVKAIHPDRKTVSVKNLETGEEFEESYDKLILSPGAKPAQPRLPGVGLENLFTLRTVEDTFRIKDHINKHNPKSVVLAGGGFIGLELAENLRELSMDVTIVQRPKQLMNPFDADMASFIHAEARKHGVKLALGYTVEGFEEKDGGVDVLLKDSAPLHADMVVLAIGITPDTALAKEAGLELGIKGSIVAVSYTHLTLPTTPYV